MQVFDYVNGAHLKKLHCHSKEVPALLYCPIDKAVLSCSWDRAIVMSDETDPDKGVALKTITNAHECDITAIAYSLELSLVASGDANGGLALLDPVATGTQQAVIVFACCFAQGWYTCGTLSSSSTRPLASATLLL